MPGVMTHLLHTLIISCFSGFMAAAPTSHACRSPWPHRDAGRPLTLQLITDTLKKLFMRMPGVEPGSQAWEAYMMPLHYMRLVELIMIADLLSTVPMAKMDSPDLGVCHVPAVAMDFGNSPG